MATSGNFDLGIALMGIVRAPGIHGITGQVFQAMASAGVPVETQVKVMWLLGIGLGHGGKGSDDSIPECPYCGCYGGGGHGGFCPNTGTDPAHWVAR